VVSAQGHNISQWYIFAPLEPPPPGGGDRHQNARLNVWDKLPTLCNISATSSLAVLEETHPRQTDRHTYRQTDRQTANTTLSHYHGADNNTRTHCSEGQGLHCPVPRLTSSAFRFVVQTDSPDHFGRLHSNGFVSGKNPPSDLSTNLGCVRWSTDAASITAQPTSSSSSLPSSHDDGVDYTRLQLI